MTKPFDIHVMTDDYCHDAGRAAADSVVLDPADLALLRQHGFGSDFLNAIHTEVEDSLPTCPYPDGLSFMEATDHWNTGFALGMESK